MNAQGKFEQKMDLSNLSFCGYSPVWTLSGLSWQTKKTNTNMHCMHDCKFHFLIFATGIWHQWETLMFHNREKKSLLLCYTFTYGFIFSSQWNQNDELVQIVPSWSTRASQSFGKLAPLTHESDPTSVPLKILLPAYIESLSMRNS